MHVEPRVLAVVRQLTNGVGPEAQRRELGEDIGQTLVGVEVAAEDDDVALRGSGETARPPQ